jgi:3-hydroxyisobutyrate dehydrogenase
MVDKAAKIGWIGTGVMGKSMIGHLMKNGHKMMVYNRTVSKTADLTASGAKFVPPQEMAKEADFLFLMLGYPQDVEEVLLHPDRGILKHMKP